MQFLPIAVLTATAALISIPQTPPTPRPDNGRTERSQDMKDMSPESKRSDDIFATWLVAGNNNAIALGELAQQKATDPEVKQFAQKMVEDHRQFLQKLTPFAAAGSMRSQDANDRSKERPNDAKDPNSDEKPRDGFLSRSMGDFDHAGLVKELSEQCLQTARKELESKSGAEFDRCFMGMAIGAHMQANDMLTVFQRHASPALKTILGDGQKAVVAHLAQAKEWAKKSEGMSSGMHDKTSK